MITDYQTLQDEIADWIDRTDLTTVIPTFIQLAESRFIRNIRILWLEKAVTLTCVPGTDTVDLPADYNGMHTLKVQANPPYEMNQMALGALTDAYRGDVSGMPLSFAVTQDKVVLAPVPDSDYELDMVYYVFEALSGTNTTNEILTRYPDAYLYASLACAESYLQHDQRIQLWKSMAEESISEIMSQDDKTRFWNSPMRTRLG